MTLMTMYPLKHRNAEANVVLLIEQNDVAWVAKISVCMCVCLAPIQHHSKDSPKVASSSLTFPSFHSHSPLL